MNVELHIDELVLEGIARRDRHRIAQALERELTRLFADGGVPPSLVQGGEITRLDGGALDVRPGSKPDAVGTQVARSVYQGLKG